MDNKCHACKHNKTFIIRGDNMTASDDYLCIHPESSNGIGQPLTSREMLEKKCQGRLFEDNELES